MKGALYGITRVPLEDDARSEPLPYELHKVSVCYSVHDPADQDVMINVVKETFYVKVYDPTYPEV